MGIDLDMILLQVCRLLSPADLLSLARTSKGLREILMSRSSITVWKSAIRSLGDLPALELPSEFSEPEWAALVFSHSCIVSLIVSLLLIAMCGNNDGTFELGMWHQKCPNG